MASEAVTQTEPRMKVMSYDAFNDGAAGVVRIVRDTQGMMWLGTQDGLYRYDGYEFQNFKLRTGDGIDMSSNRIGGLTPVARALCGALSTIINRQQHETMEKTWH